MFFLLTIIISSIEFNTPGDYNFFLKPGLYNVSCYGAQGGRGYLNGKTKSYGGKGAFATAHLNITGEGRLLFGTVGGKGGEESEKGPNSGGFNGGGEGGIENGADLNGHDAGGGGGGATDLRIYDNSIWNRIFVAAGGSGGAADCDGAPGGNIYGFYATKSLNHRIDTSVNQESSLTLGLGGHGAKDKDYSGSGGGGGYRGGPGGKGSGDSWEAVGRSGSSHIPGYKGCATHQDLSFRDGYILPGFNEGDGKILITNLIQCSSGCSSCSDENTCYSCYEGFLHNNACISNCPDGFYSIGQKCFQCDPTCASCTNSNTCTKCQNGFYLYEDKCIPNCPSEYFKNSNTNECQKCTEPCEKCTSAENCLTCIDKYHIYNNRCYAICPEGTTDTGNACEKCSPFCKSCFQTANFCTSCFDDYFLYENQCVASCPQKTFEKNKQCSQCHEPCNTCVESNDHCTTCIDDFYLYNNKCVLVCPEGTTTKNHVCV